MTKEQLEIALCNAREALITIEEEAFKHADIEDGPDGMVNRPNLAMRIQVTAENAIDRINRVLGDAR